ncbi:hypothetical protein RIF29_15015 [Crotalaria pallida]|uniref:Uncharacterized protein n=1 Tax=Crotalaria pallida TaxID=3830 RepID=A0AAN9FCR7_CROPI
MAQGMEAHRDVLRRYNGNNMVKNGSTVADKVLYRDVLLKPNDNYVKGSHGTHANTKSGALNMVKRPDGDTRQKGTWLPKGWLKGWFRLMERSHGGEAINRVVKVMIDGEIFDIRILEEPFVDFLTFRGKKKLEDQEAAMGSSGFGGSQATAASEFNDDDSTSGDDDCINHGLGNDNDFEFFNEDLEEENINNENILQKNLERMHTEEFPDVSNISLTHVQKIAAEFIMEEEQFRNSSSFKNNSISHVSDSLALDIHDAHFKPTNICPTYGPACVDIPLGGSPIEKKQAQVRFNRSGKDDGIPNSSSPTITKPAHDIEELEAKAEESVLDDQEIVTRGMKHYELWKLASNRESLLLARSRINWLKEGDANTKCFHAVINHRRCTNKLKTIRFEDRWIEGVVEVKEAVKNFFKNHFVEPMPNRPLLQGVSFG